MRINVEGDDIVYIIEYENEFGNICVEHFVFTLDYKDIEEHFNKEILRR